MKQFIADTTSLILAAFLSRALGDNVPLAQERSAQT